MAGDPGIRILLESDPQNPAFRQHLGLVRLMDRLPLVEAYDAITDISSAIDAAMDFVDDGDAEGIADLCQAVPELSRTAFVSLGAGEIAAAEEAGAGGKRLPVISSQAHLRQLSQGQAIRLAQRPPG